MNVKLISLFMSVLLLLSMTACNPDVVHTDATEETLIPGVVEIEEPVVNPFETEATDATEHEDNPTDPTEASNSKTENPMDTTTPSEEVTEPTKETTPSEETVPPTEEENQGSTGTTAYEDYLNMTGEQQLAFMQSFDSMEAFFAWLNAAKAEYEAQNPGTDVGDGNIDFGGGN